MDSTNESVERHGRQEMLDVVTVESVAVWIVSLPETELLALVADWAEACDFAKTINISPKTSVAFGKKF